jgi:hypothetical protein
MITGYDVELVGRGLLGIDTVDRERLPDALGHRPPIAGDHRDVPDSFAPQPLDDPLGVRADLIGHDDDAGEAPVERDDHVSLS